MGLLVWDEGEGCPVHHTPFEVDGIRGIICHACDDAVDQYMTDLLLGPGRWLRRTVTSLGTWHRRTAQIRAVDRAWQAEYANRARRANHWMKDEPFPRLNWVILIWLLWLLAPVAIVWIAR